MPQTENAIFIKMLITQIFICAKYFSLSWSIWQNNFLTTYKQHYTIVRVLKQFLKNLFSLWNNGKKKVKMELTRNLFLHQLSDVPAIAQEEFFELLNVRAAKTNFFNPMELGVFLAANEIYEYFLERTSFEASDTVSTTYLSKISSLKISGGKFELVDWPK